MRKQGRSQSPRQAKLAGHHGNIDYNMLMDQDSAGSMSSQKAMAIIDGGTGGGNMKNSEMRQGMGPNAGRGAHERHHSAMQIGSNGADNSYIDTQ